MTWPTMTFNGKMTLWLGKLRGAAAAARPRPHQGRHGRLAAAGDASCSRGDLVEFDATPYAGDAYFKDWPKTLDNVAALEPEKLVPGRGAALTTPSRSREGLDGTRAFITDAVRQRRSRASPPGKDLRAVYKETYAALQAEVRPLGDLRPLHAVRRDPRATTRRRSTPTRASGPPSATRRCGRRWKAEPRDARTARSERRARRTRLSRRSQLRTTSALRPTRMPRRTGAPPGRSWSAPDRSAWRWRSTSRSAASPVVLLDDDDRLSTGSRAICFAKRTLEIFDRLGCGEPHGRQGRVVERRQGLLPATSWSTLRPAARSRATRARRSSTCSSTTSRGICASARADAAESRDALEEQGRRRRRSTPIAST